MTDQEYEDELRGFAAALMRGERPRRPDTPDTYHRKEEK